MDYRYGLMEFMYVSDPSNETLFTIYSNHLIPTERFSLAP